MADVSTTGGKKGGEKAPKNIVHEQAIQVETIRKELRDQKLCEHFSINPFVKSIMPYSI